MYCRDYYPDMGEWDMSNKLDQYGFLDKRDSSHNNSFAAICDWLKGEFGHATIWINPVYHILFKHPIFWIKNPDFRFHNAEGWREVFYNKVLKYIKWDPYCSVNPDQCDPLIVYSCLSKNHKFIWKFIFGMIAKLGFFGNNGENILYKPSILAPVARLYKVYPIYWLLDIYAYISSYFTVRKTIEEETTVKIRLYLYLVYADINNQSTIWTEKIKDRIINSPDGKEIASHLAEGIDLRKWTLSYYFKAAFLEYWGSNHIIAKNMDYELLK